MNKRMRGQVRISKHRSGSRVRAVVSGDNIKEQQLPKAIAGTGSRHATSPSIMTYQLSCIIKWEGACKSPIYVKHQTPMRHLNLGNLMDVQERHITVRRLSEVLARLNMWVCLLALTGEAGSELASHFSRRHDLRLEAAPIPNLTQLEYPVTPEAARRPGSAEQERVNNNGSRADAEAPKKYVHFLPQRNRTKGGTVSDDLQELELCLGCMVISRLEKCEENSGVLMNSAALFCEVRGVKWVTEKQRSRRVHDVISA
ncbi:hypothetical protein J6590_027680 [Homalodisca vitripennis]|nr:hypothetical protein J6590_027680 [Homalodisca vitripennis]